MRLTVARLHDPEFDLDYVVRIAKIEISRF